MTRRERLTATIRGEPVDRPPVSFYEINGLDQDPSDPSPFNVYSDPSWAPLIELAREKTDRIVMRGVPLRDAPPDPLGEFTTVETHHEDGSLVTTRTVRAGRRTLTSRTRRDPGLNTVWTTEHLLKDADDLRAWIDLPEAAPSASPGGEPDVSSVLEAEEKLGETGIVMIETGDPLCEVAGEFDLGEYTVIAMTEPGLFGEALDKVARRLYPRIEAVARALPGRLWRICGPEYASPPYLPPSLFEEYVTRYDSPVVETIHRHGGYARVHSHGRLRDILDHIAATGCMGLDPIEPPPQGDVSLGYVRERYGQQFVLFGNLEASDIERLPTPEFERKVATALDEGTAGEGRGFVLMPSACPCGRRILPLTLANYETMIEMIERLYV